MIVCTSLHDLAITWSEFLVLRLRVQCQYIFPLYIVQRCSSSVSCTEVGVPLAFFKMYIRFNSMCGDTGYIQVIFHIHLCVFCLMEDYRTVVEILK